mgnify:CR=1 FL=1
MFWNIPEPVWIRTSQGKKGKVYEIDTLKNINAKIFNPTKIDRSFKTTVNNESSVWKAVSVVGPMATPLCESGSSSILSNVSHVMWLAGLSK